LKGLPRLAFVWLSACSAAAPLHAGSMLPAEARAAPARYIVVTIANPLTPPSRAASSLRGYEGAGPYLAGSEARVVSRALMREYHLSEGASWPIALLGVHCLVYAIQPDTQPAQLLARLRLDPRVESAQPLLGFETAARSYNDPYAKLQHNLEQMGVPAAQALSRGAGVRVAVVDTGVQADHPDLPRSLVARNFVDHDAAAFETDAHGTAVAGIIAAVPDNGIGIAGVAPDALVLAFKACWRAAADGIRAVCNTFTIAQAIAAAIEARADIINLSLAGPGDPLLTRLVRHALDAGIIVVGAASPSGAADQFPTGIAGVIAVDAAENHNADPAVVGAPGRDVLSLAPQGHYDYYSGSSLATAQVSGIIALLRSKQARLTAADARRLLAPGAAGLPDACAALGLLLHRSGCAAQ
jgi:subtilisin family serine protease